MMRQGEEITIAHPVASFHNPLNMDVYRNSTTLRPADIVRFNAYWPYRSVSAPVGKKRVSFNHKIRIVENPSFLTANEIQRVWWSCDELLSIKKKAKQMCSRLRKRRDAAAATGSSDAVCPVSDAFRKTKMVLNSDAKHPALCLADGLGNALYEWCATMDGRRGLERFASKEFAALRRTDVVDTRTAVVQEQTRQSQTGDERDDEFIARVARLTSKTARVFAAFVGEADANAAFLSYEEADDNNEDWSSDFSMSSSEIKRPSKRNKLNNAGGSPAA